MSLWRRRPVKLLRKSVTNNVESNEWTTHKTLLAAVVDVEQEFASGERGGQRLSVIDATVPRIVGVTDPWPDGVDRIEFETRQWTILHTRHVDGRGVTIRAMQA